MSFKEPKKIAIITSTINAHEFTEILDNFLIPPIENWFSDDEAIFSQNDNSSCPREKVIKAFLQEINDIARLLIVYKFNWKFRLEI